MSLTPVQQKAYDDIHGRLSSGTFNPVTHADVNAAAAKIKELSATDANAVIAEMRRTGELDKLASEGTDGAWFGNGGYSAEERRDLFNDLAGKLDGNNLAAVSNAFENAGGGQDGYNLAKEFASAVASHASPTAKVDYIKALSAETADGKGFNGADIFGGGSWSRDVDGDAAAVATVLGSLRGAQAQEAFSHLAQNPDQLRAVLKTGIDESARYSQGGAVISFDTAGFRGVMDAASSIADPDLKARIFDAGATQLRTIRDTPSISIGAQSIDRDTALAEVRDGLTKLIDSDTTGVVRELTYNQDTANGSSLAAYTQVMFDTGQTEKMAEQITKLQFGNEVKTNPQDPMARLDQVTIRNGKEVRENAGALGYYVGSVQAGALADAKDNKASQDNMTALLKSMNAIVGAFTGPGGAAITGAGGEWINKGVEAAMGNTSVSAANRLSQASLPHYTPDPNKPYDVERAPGEYFADWSVQRNHVVEHAEP